MAERYVHDIDPVLATVGGVHLWWYGLGFALGFLHLQRFLLRDRRRLGLSPRDVWSLSILLTAGVLAAGRFVEIAFDEWPFYRAHPRLIPAFWLGGMATHGLLTGAALATFLFAVVWKKPFLALADSLAVPGALLMGLGRIGNFIDGQIVGGVTDAWWAVEFPYADGFRHPVVLYDGAKNLLLVAYLLYVRRTNTTPGAVAARFVFWYAFPRIFIDLFRDYPAHRLAIGTGQTLNLFMAAIGVVLLLRSRLRRLRLSASPVPGAVRVPATSVSSAGVLSLPPATCVSSVGSGLTNTGLHPAAPQPDAQPSRMQRVAFASLLAVCLTIPSNWTQNVPVRYGHRHPGLTHSWLYPDISWAPPPPSDMNPRGRAR